MACRLRPKKPHPRAGRRVPRRARRASPWPTSSPMLPGDTRGKRATRSWGSPGASSRTPGSGRRSGEWTATRSRTPTGSIPATRSPPDPPAVAPGVPIRDPESGEVLGIEAKWVGDARVRRYGNPTTLEITKSRQEVNKGDKLAPARELSYPNYVPRAPEKPIRGVIMTVEDGVSEFGQFQIITINRGARDGLELGHVLASYRRGQLVTSSGHAESADALLTENAWWKGIWPSSWGLSLGEWGETKPNPVVPSPPGMQSADTATAGAALADGPIRLPDERNGLIFVFRVFDKMSYAMVMRANRPIYIGDIVRTP